MAKSINLVGSAIEYVYIERQDDGSVQLMIVGNSIDDNNGQAQARTMEIDWNDLPANVKNTGNNFLKHLSREYNNFIADEDSETWVNP